MSSCTTTASKIMSQLEREGDFQAWWKKIEGAHRMVKAFYVPITKEGALTTAMVVTLHSHKDSRHCLDIMKKDDIALKVKGVRIFPDHSLGRPQNLR